MCYYKFIKIIINYYSKMNKNNILTELLDKQLKDVVLNKKLIYKDFVRILKNINSSLFCKDFCCIWTGYVVIDEKDKSSYINFYFKQKKVSLHRLLYINFVEPLQDNEYIKFSCRNRGKCCNINHMIKMSKEEKDKEKEDKMLKEKEELKRSFTIEFD